MAEDNSLMAKWEELTDFIQLHAEGNPVYIYGHELVHKMIAKYLSISEIKISGFILSEVREVDKGNEKFPVTSLSRIKEESNAKKIKVIIASDDGMCNQIIDLLKTAGVNDIYIVSDWMKQAIIEKMSPRLAEKFGVEVNIADHCNLNCQCCDHFSPIASETFLDIEQYEKDIERLAKLTNQKMARMTLLGGEPLLNEKVIDYIRITRKYLPDTNVEIYTNGLLLPKWGAYEDDRNIWKAVVKYDVSVNLTQYPIPLQLDKIIDKAKEYGVPVTFEKSTRKGARLWLLYEVGDLEKEEKCSTKNPLDLTGEQEKYRFIGCFQFNKCIVLRDGKIYTCPIIPYSHFFNERFNQNLQVKEDCYIDIHKAQSFEEIAEFVTHRPSFCDCCAVHERRVTLPWKQSEQDISEWT